LKEKFFFAEILSWAKDVVGYVGGDLSENLFVFGHHHYLQ
jgi:hypothetical protein